jgi:hypothetical protein
MEFGRRPPLRLLPSSTLTVAGDRKVNVSGLATKLCRELNPSTGQIQRMGRLDISAELVDLSGLPELLRLIQSEAQLLVDGFGERLCVRICFEAARDVRAPDAALAGRQDAPDTGCASVRDHHPPDEPPGAASSATSHQSADVQPCRQWRGP